MLNHPISPPPGNVLATARNSHTPLLRQQAEPKAQNRQYDLRVRMLLLMEENMHQLRLVVFAMTCRALYIPGDAAFLPSTVFPSRMARVSNGCYWDVFLKRPQGSQSTSWKRPACISSTVTSINSNIFTMVAWTCYSVVDISI